jgi:hypothetical protein
MIRLIIAIFIIIVICLGVDYMLVDLTSDTNKITVVEKYVDNNNYIIGTMSLQKFETSKDIYDKLNVGGTYTVKLSSDKIIGVVV